MFCFFHLFCFLSLSMLAETDSVVIDLGLGFDFNSLSAFKIYFEFPLEMDFVFTMGVGFWTDFKVVLCAHGVVNVLSSYCLSLFLHPSTFFNLSKIIKSCVVKFSKFVTFILTPKLLRNKMVDVFIFISKSNNVLKS